MLLPYDAPTTRVGFDPTGWHAITRWGRFDPYTGRPLNDTYDDARRTTVRDTDDRTERGTR